MKHFVIRNLRWILFTVALSGLCAFAPEAAALAGTAPVRTNAQAAALVHLDPNFEPRPDNYVPNHTIPTQAQLAAYRNDHTLSFLWPGGNAIMGWVNGEYTGTTDEILQWGAYKWGFDPDLVRAIAANESWWHQYESGADVGILQVHLASFPAAYPMVLQSTAFNVDFKLAYQRACVDGYINYLSRLTPLDGHHRYPSPDASEQLWGCVGNWYSGGWYDAGAINYIAQVKALMAQRPWVTDPYF